MRIGETQINSIKKFLDQINIICIQRLVSEMNIKINKKGMIKR